MTPDLHRVFYAGINTVRTRSIKKVVVIKDSFFAKHAGSLIRKIKVNNQFISAEHPTFTV
ncbi:hypothetical protein DSECCO2_621060 [anaerobic digester metagenome]